MTPLQPYRGAFGGTRPSRLAALALPPAAMPSRLGLRPLKAWRYVGVFSPEIALCAAVVRVGPFRQLFWAVWDREHRELREGTRAGRGSEEVVLMPGRLLVARRDVEIELTLEEEAGVETVGPHGAHHAWTRKQGGVRAHGSARIGDRVRPLDARAVIDDSAGYHARATAWRWSAGVGASRDGRRVAWNLVEGLNDAPQASERTVWIDGSPHEVPPVRFDADLSAVGGLRFAAEAVRARRDNLLIVRSSYEQPFGTFSGTLPGGPELAEGFGVMERHAAWW